MKTKRLFTELFNEFMQYCQMQGELWDSASCQVGSVDFVTETIRGTLTCESYINNDVCNQRVWSVSIQKHGRDDYKYTVETVSGHKVYKTGSLPVMIPTNGLN